MKKELFKFIEGIPATAGYANYECFQEGAIVYLDEDFPWKYCILCDDNGDFIPNDEGDYIVLDWIPSFGEYPIWEDKLEPYKEIEYEEEDYSFDEILSQKDMLSIIKDLPDNATIHLDTDGSVVQEYLQRWGKDSILVLTQKGRARLLSITPPQSSIKSPDINDFFNSLDDLEHLTINFHKHD